MSGQLEVADVIRRFLPRLDRTRLPAHHQRTLRALMQCRTAALGGHIDECNECGYIRISYNSCRNRHCPKCQGVNKESWIIMQEDMLLPVVYFHVVFTLPHELNPLCLHNPKVLYDLLFKSAWHTLNTLAKDEQWIGAQTAATMLLHTWSQTLVLHPHLHCIVPNGGITKQGEWQFPKRGVNNFLFPVKAMQKIYRGYFLANLKRKIKTGAIKLPKDYSQGKSYQKWLDDLYEKSWVVYAKKPFSGVKKVIDYVGRYSHRVALTNHRIQSIGADTVSFTYKDYKDGAKRKLMTLEGAEFLRRFCMHILPKGFRKVRQYGFLSNASKKKKIAIARAALQQKHTALLDRAQRKAKALTRLFKAPQDQCPCCGEGKLITIFGWDGGSNLPPPIQQLINDNSKTNID